MAFDTGGRTSRMSSSFTAQQGALSDCETVGLLVVDTAARLDRESERPLERLDLSRGAAASAFRDGACVAETPIAIGSCQTSAHAFPTTSSAMLSHGSHRSWRPS